MRRSRDVSRSLVSNSRLACARHTVFRENREEPFDRPLSNLVVDFCSSFLLQDRVAVHTENVVHTTDAKTLTQDSKFRLRVLRQLNMLVHCPNDICLGQELVRNELSKSHSDCE